MTQAFNLSQFANKVNSSGQADLTSAVTGTLPVANGGTGTSTPSLVAGTNISISGSFPNQTINSTAAAFSGDSGQVFTSSGTFTIPSGITKLKVTVVGGGGNSGGTTNNPAAIGGGGGGGAAIKFLTGLTSGNTLSVTVGGAAGTSSVSSGSQSISTISGGGGGSTSSGSGVSGGASGGSGSGGDINISGGQGGSGMLFLTTRNCSYATGGAGGRGGDSLLGRGAVSPYGDASTSAGGISGQLYGGGASGGMRPDYAGNVGGASGAAGVVMIEW